MTALPASIKDLLIQKEVLSYETLKPLVPTMLSGIPDRPGGSENDFTAPDMKDVAYTAGRLYVLDHPDNPYKGDAETLGICLTLADSWCDDYETARRDGRPMNTTEWPPYIMTQLVDMLGTEAIGEERLARWKENIELWGLMMVAKPFLFTSPNHEAWKCMCLWSAGELLERREWCESAVFQMRQEMRFQTDAGFWEESRHHGPSMKYNFMQLHAMARLAKLSGDEEILAAVTRLAEFMARFTFPDGTTMGCLDGRQSYALGPWLAVVPGQELTPSIREMTRRSVATQYKYGCFTDAKYLSTSNWYMTYGMVMLTDGSRFFDEVAEPPAAHSLDAEGAVVENHSAVLDGGGVRRGGFVCAVSGIMSDMAAAAQSRFRLQRQNRIDLWHERTGLILGGGHGVHRQNPPYANVIVDTGDAGESSFGLVDGDQWYRVRGYFCPRAIASSFDGGEARLELHFAHASIWWHLTFPEDGVAAIDYRFVTRDVKRLAVQILPVFWRDCEFRVDGAAIDPYAPAVHNVKDTIEVANTVLGGSYTIERAAGEGESRLRTPLEPLRTYGELYEEEAFDTVWKQCLLSIQIDGPPPEGEGLIRISVK